MPGSGTHSSAGQQKPGLSRSSSTNEDVASILKKRKPKVQEVKNVGEDSILQDMHSYTFTTLPFTKPKEFHCEVLTGLLENLLAVFCKQEMSVRGCNGIRLPDFNGNSA